MRSNLLFPVLLLAVTATCFAQGIRAQDPAEGKLLVSSRNLLDPNFAQTVVLLIRMDDDGVLGLVINRRTKIPLSKLFDNLKKGGSDVLYSGGPVGRTGVMALLRGRNRREGAERVFADVSLVTAKTPLEKVMATGTDPSTLRVYLGYAGWTADQLQNEIDAGAWTVFPGDSGMVFDAAPDTVWTRMIQRTESGIALRSAPRPNMLVSCTSWFRISDPRP